MGFPYKVPVHPDEFDWTLVFPRYYRSKLVEFVDVRCGSGGVLVTLAPMYPETFMVGLDVTEKIIEFANCRIESLRYKYLKQYDNIAVFKADIRKKLTNYFYKGQLKKMFFRYADPYLRLSKYRSRIINEDFITEYAYLLADEGMIYLISDEKDVFRHIVALYENHPLFVRIPKDEMQGDPIIKKLMAVAGKGVKNIVIHVAVYKKIMVE